MMWILIGGRCPTEEERKFKRNPNLEFFLSQEERSYFSPVFSPDGEKVYCIMRRWFSYHIKSLLVSISTDDKKINKIVEDSVVVFTLNHRGDEIAYVKGLIDCMCEDPGFRLNDEDKIIFINTLTGNIIKEFDPVCPFVWDLEFTHDDDFLIFLGYGDTALRGFYRLNLKTLKETLLFTTEWLSNEEWYIVCDLYLFNLKENWILY